MTTSEAPRPYWGTILKSNWNGTYFGTSIENVNRDERGYVDFEKMIGLDGIALINIVSNAETAAIAGTKELQTRITHNDGGSWKTLNPPKYDSHGQTYDCRSAVRVLLLLYFSLGTLMFLGSLAHSTCMGTRSESTPVRRSAARPSSGSSWRWEMWARSSRHTRRATRS